MPTTLLSSDFSAGLPSTWTNTGSLPVAGGVIGGIGVASGSSGAERVVNTGWQPHASGQSTIAAAGYRAVEYRLAVIHPYAPSGLQPAASAFGFLRLHIGAGLAALDIHAETVYTASPQGITLRLGYRLRDALNATVLSADGVTAPGVLTGAQIITVNAALVYQADALTLQISGTATAAASSYAPALASVTYTIPATTIRSAFGLATNYDLRLIDWTLSFGRRGSADFLLRSQFAFDAIEVLDHVVGPVVVALPAASPSPIAPPAYSVPSQAQPVAASEAALTTLAGNLVGNAENDGSTDTLPVQPSYALAVTDGYGVTEHPYDGGYFASHSTTGKRRRRWTMHWDAINATEVTAMLALSVATDGRRRSMLWTDATTGEVVRVRFAEEPVVSQIAGAGAEAVYSCAAAIEEVHA